MGNERRTIDCKVFPPTRTPRFVFITPRSTLRRAWQSRHGLLSRGAFVVFLGAVFLSTPASIHAASLTLGEVTAAPGQTQVSLPLSLSLTTGEQLSALMVDVYFDATSVQWQSVVVEPTVVAVGKQVAFNLVAPGHARLVLYGLDRQVFSSGTIARCLLQVPTSAPVGTTVVSLRDGFGASPDAVETALLLYDGRLWIQALPDTTPPVISALAASGITQTAATVTWTTDEGATSQVEYGSTTSYGTSTPIDTTLTLSHTVSLSGLSAGMLYHYRVHSKDAASHEAVSADATFTTQPLPTVQTPTITPAGGTFSGSVTVTLATATVGATIRYTTDGTDPNASSLQYSQPFSLTSSATVKAKAFQGGMNDSAIASASFTITTSTNVTFTAAQSSASSGGWWPVGTEKVAWNGGEWLEYPVDFGSGGAWVAKMTATNQNNSSAPALPTGYAFNVSVNVDGVWRGTIKIPGSTTTYMTAGVSINMPSGRHTVRFTWTNDAWLAGVYDANIRVKNVSFTSSTTTTPSTSSPTTSPSIAVTNPLPGGTVTGPTVYLTFTVSGVQVGTATGYHVDIRLDGGETWHVYSTDPFGLRNLIPGGHVIELTLVDVNHVRIPGASTYVAVRFTVQ